MSNLSYASRLKALSLHSWNIDGYSDIIGLHVYYKILFGRVTVDHSKMFTVTHHVKTREHQWKLNPMCINLRKHFVNVS